MRKLSTKLLRSGEYTCIYEHMGLLERASVRCYAKRSTYATMYIAQVLQFSKSSEWEVWEEAYKELKAHLHEAKGYCYEPVYKMAEEELKKLREEVENISYLIEEEEYEDE